MNDEPQKFRPEHAKIRRQFTIFALMGGFGTPALLLYAGIGDWSFIAIGTIITTAATVGICALVFLLPTPRYVKVRGDSLQLARRILPDTEISLPEIEKVELYTPQNSIRLFKHEGHHAVADMTLRLSYFGESEKKEVDSCHRAAQQRFFELESTLTPHNPR